MAQRYEYQDIDGHVILLFVHPAKSWEEEVKAGRKQSEEKEWYRQKKNDSQSSLEVIFCTPSGARTLDPLIKSQLLYQLS